MYDFSWGMTAYASEQGIKRLPKERIFITHDPTATGHQNQQKKTWSPSVNLYYSDDFFKSKKLALNNGNSIIKTDHYMFIAKATKREMVEIYVSNVLHGFLNFERTRLPTEALTSKTFTVMDTSEETVFLHIQTHGTETPLGDIFVSDGSGKFYSMSVSDVLRGSELVDFEKVNSLEGVFLANKFEDERVSSRDRIMQRKSAVAQQSSGANAPRKKELTEAEIEAQTIQHARMSQGNNGNVNKKQKQTEQATKRETGG